MSGYEGDIIQSRTATCSDGAECHHGRRYDSRLFQRVREEEGLAYSVYSYADFFKDSGLFGAFVGIKPDSTQRALATVLEEFEKALKSPPSADEIKSAQSQLKGSLLLGLESMGNRMARLAKSEIYCGRYVSMDELISMIDQVDVGAIVRVAELVLNRENLSVVALGPSSKKEILRLVETPVSGGV